jgi:hypothetical protein
MTQNELDRQHFTVAFDVRVDRIRSGFDQRLYAVLNNRRNWWQAVYSSSAPQHASLLIRVFAEICAAYLYRRL